MIGKQYFKIEFFMKKKSIKEGVEYLTNYIQRNPFACALQNVHTDKRVPSIQVQVNGAKVVHLLINNMMKDEHTKGYVVWLSKEDDFFAIKDCSLVEIDHTLAIENAEEESTKIKTSTKRRNVKKSQPSNSPSGDDVLVQEEVSEDD